MSTKPEAEVLHSESRVRLVLLPFQPEGRMATSPELFLSMFYELSRSTELLRLAAALSQLSLAQVGTHVRSI